MRYYLLRQGHIRAVEVVTDASDDAAVKEAEALFAKREDKENFSGFEVWDCARFVHRHPVLPPKYTTNLERVTTVTTGSSVK